MSLLVVVVGAGDDQGNWNRPTLPRRGDARQGAGPAAPVRDADKDEDGGVVGMTREMLRGQDPVPAPAASVLQLYRDAPLRTYTLCGRGLAMASVLGVSQDCGAASYAEERREDVMDQGVAGDVGTQGPGALPVAALVENRELLLAVLTRDRLWSSTAV